MPTKKILMRGISRTPSDRMSADGGLAESIGFVTDMQELAVDTPAVDVTSQHSLGLVDGEFVYIHKTTEYSNYIAANSTTVRWMNTTTPQSIYTFGTGERLRDIKSVGNTLLLLIEKDVDGAPTPQHMEYILFKDGSYIDLGSEIPEPRVKVRCHGWEDTPHPEVLNDGTIGTGNFLADYVTILKNERGAITEGNFPGGYTLVYPYYILTRRNHPEDSIDFVDGSAEGDPLLTRKAIRGIRSELYSYWQTLVNTRVEENAFYGLLSWPRFARYAIRLYDGTYVRHSAPILLCHPTSTYPLKDVSLHFLVESTIAADDFSLRMKSGKMFDAYYADFYIDDTASKNTFSLWSDIIAGVDIFISDDIIPYSFEDGAVTDAESHFIQDEYYTMGASSWFHSHSLTEEQMLDRVLSKSNFYRFLSLKTEDYTKQTAEQIYYSTASYPIIHDNRALVTSPTLPDDIAKSNNVLIPNNIKVYNERLLSVGGAVKYYPGYYELQSRLSAGGSHSAIKIKYYIKKSSGVDLVVEKSYSSAFMHIFKPGCWLYYPDPRCYRCEIMADLPDYQVTVCKRLAMKEHPYLDGAYCLVDFGTSVEDSGESIDDPVFPSLNDREPQFNTLFQFDGSNMFLLKNQQSFPFGNLTDLAVITKPLSTGQVGYSNLYVFSDQGLWAIASKQDGSMGDVDSISQDVALPGTVCQLDQAVVFTTDKGVMLLTGMDLRCISEGMHGKHYKLDKVIYDTLTAAPYDSVWGELASLAYEDMPFMEYVKNSRTAYDYINRRLLLFNQSQNRPGYIYVFKLDTETWHKIVLPEGYSFQRVLNGYPETLIAADHAITVNQNPSHSSAIMKYSVARSQTDGARYNALLVTRPMDMDEDDIRKVLNRIYVRGTYPPTAEIASADIGSPVRVMLLGSLNGTDWQKLTSLRGGSYKLFKVVVLARLLQTERISYLETEYETRYATRLR